MKNNYRIIGIISILLISCLLFSGCGLIDDMREAQGFYADDETFTYKDNTYKLLPANEYFQPSYDYWDSESLYITKRDVPVLLSGMFYEWEILIADDDRFFISPEIGVFCKEDIYDDMVKRVNEEFKPNKACYFYEVYEEDIYNSTTECYVLSDDEYNTIKTILSSVEPAILPESGFFEDSYTVSLELCSDDLLFRSYVMDLIMTENNYYILLNNEDQTTSTYTIPSEYHDILAKIMKASVDADNQLYDYYETEETL